MLRAILVLLFLSTTGAQAQGFDQLSKWCYGDATDEQTIQGCNAVIAAGTATGRNIADAFHNRGLAYSHKGQYDLAIKDYDQAITLNPNHAGAFNNRGAAYGRKGELDRSIEDYSQAIRLNPKQTVAFNNRGRAYIRKGRYDLAIQDCDQSIKLNPKLAPSYYIRGLAYSRDSQHDRAIQDFDQAIKLDPGLAVAFADRGYAYDQKGQYDRALQDYDQAIKLDPNLAEALVNRGNAKRKTGDTVGGDADLAAAKALSPAAQASPLPPAPPPPASFAGEVLAALVKTPEYTALKAYHDKKKVDAAWLASAQGRAVSGYLDGLRADALAARIVESPKPGYLEYFIDGASVVDKGIMPGDLKGDRDYRAFVAASVATNMANERKLKTFLESLTE